MNCFMKGYFLHYANIILLLPIICTCLVFSIKISCKAADQSESTTEAFTQNTDSAQSISADQFDGQTFHYINAADGYLYTYDPQTLSFSKKRIYYWFHPWGRGGHSALYYSYEKDGSQTPYTGYILNSKDYMYRYGDGDYYGASVHEKIPLADGFIYCFSGGKKGNKYTGHFYPGDGHYYYSKNGKIDVVTGWTKVSNFGYFYYNNKHQLLYRYMTQSDVVRGDRNPDTYYPANTLILLPDDRKLHLISQKGEIVRVGGTKAVSSKVFYIIGNNGVVDGKFTRSNGILRYYTYNYSTHSWELVKNTWKAVECNNTNQSYYFDSRGIATMICSSSIKGITKLYLYNGGKKTAAPEGIYNVQIPALTYGFENDPQKQLVYVNSKSLIDRPYEYNESNSFWKVYNGNLYRICGSTVTAKVVKQGDIRRYYIYDLNSCKWVLQKNVYLSIPGKYIYFGNTGKSNKINDKKTGKTYILSSSGKMVLYAASASTFASTAKKKSVCSHSWKKVYSTEYIENWVEHVYSSEYHWYCGYCCMDLSDGVHDIDHTIDCGSYYYDADFMEWIPEGANYFSNGNYSICRFVTHKAKTVKHQLYMQCNKCGQIQ